MAKLISKTYGDALFETALEENHVDELFDEVNALRQILKENDDFNKIMNHPKILKEEKEKLMEDVFKGKMSDELTGFLRIIIMNKRYCEIDSILEYFIQTVKEYKKIGVAYVSTPLPLSDAQKKAVEDKLLATTPYASMEMNYIIDESLIGGMVMRIGDKVVDSSVKSKLAALEKELMSIQLTAEN